MYQPPAFRVEDHEEIGAMLHRSPLAQLAVITNDGTLAATPVPLLLNAERTALIGHLARPNDVTRSGLESDDQGLACIAMFTGGNGYISPSAYPSKAEHGKVVPTWNYETVHVHGRLHIYADADRTLAAVRALTTHFETGRNNPWSDTDAPTDYIENLLKTIVAIEIVIDRIEAKHKMSQNRPPKDQAGVRADLATRGPSAELLRARMNARSELERGFPS